MKIKEHLFLFCLTGTLFLTAGVVFLPRYFSRSLDMRNLNQVEASEREDFSFLEQGSNDLYDVARAFEHLKWGEEDPILLTTISEPIQISSELLQQIYIQVMTAVEYGMLPWIGPFTDSEVRTMDENSIFVWNEPFEDIERDDEGNVLSKVWINWIDYVKSAQYYTITFESEEKKKKKELLNFWYVRFSDGERFDYSFIVNAVNYQIYYAELHNIATQMIVDESAAYGWEEDLVADTVPYVAFADGCALYYEAMGCEYVGTKNLYQKLGIFILYLENDVPVYIEMSAVGSDASWKYNGICIGFQDLVHWVRGQQDLQE